MSFSPQTQSILRHFSGKNNPVILNVVNRLSQEYSIEGFIQKGYTYKNGYKTETKSITENYFVFYFGNGKHSNIQIFAPSNYYALNLKSIVTLDNVVLYENENYYEQLEEIKNSVYNKFGDENYFTTNSPFQNLNQYLLGKTVLYRGDEFPEIYDKECLVTYLGRTEHENLVRFQLRYGTLKKDIIVNNRTLRRTIYILPSLYSKDNEV